MENSLFLFCDFFSKYILDVIWYYQIFFYNPKELLAL